MGTEFYTNNALYEYLEDNHLPNYIFAKEDIWLVIYGDKESNPKIILVISAVDKAQYEHHRFSPKENEIMTLAMNLASQSGLTYRVIRYCKEDEEIFYVQYIDYTTMRIRNININLLSKLFNSCGISTTPAKTHKYLNDKTSSAFHKWQRAVLGKSVTVSDIDLIKRHPEGTLSFYELKRSYKTLEEWAPYPDDYPNFRLIQRFADLINAEFKIVYNRRIKEPFNDDIRELKIYSFDAGNNTSTYCDTVKLDDFLGGNYHG